MTLSYVGNEAHHLLGETETNPGNAALCLSVSQPSQVAAGSPTCGPGGENNIYTTASGQTINGTRPYSVDLRARAKSRLAGFRRRRVGRDLAQLKIQFLPGQLSKRYRFIAIPCGLHLVESNRR